ncbi:thiamine pyrophosphate-dependent enzyme [Sneathiella sp.]|uniref:thiamine pyrophosphate-dependent enzyme n=1 Tax=Sneathiella sp. TaxID=1964365 RepID=UPI003562557E
MSTKLQFRSPSARPGDVPDFSQFHVSAPGELPVPDLRFDAVNPWKYATGLIRVLDSEGNATGPWADYLGDDGDDNAILLGLKDIMKMRAIDARMQNAQRQGKITFYLQCTGEEAIGSGFQRMLSSGDMNFPTYRQPILLIAADYPLQSLLGQLYSNQLDPLQGRQLPTMHSARDYGFFTISGNLGTQYVQSVGWAMANALTNNSKIAAGWIGDGATASNDFHSALLSASVYKPPVVLNIVNNQWAISTYSGIASGNGVTFAARGIGYGLPAIRVDGNDYLAVLAASKWAIARARKGYGPTIIEWLTYRAAAHSTSDDPSAYRPKNEADAWPLGDPLDRLKTHAIKQGIWSKERHTQAEAEFIAEVKEVQKEVEAHGTLIDPASMSPAGIFRGVYEKIPPHLNRQRQEMGY